MPRSSKLRKWAFVHKWTSLVCTIFLLIICITGLPLIFSEEIDHWLEPTVYEELPAGTPNAGLDRLAALSRQMYPGHIISSIFVDDDEPQSVVWMAPSWETLEKNPKSAHFIRFDARTTKVLQQSQPLGEQPLTFMRVMLSLHTDLFAGLPGELFLGFMGLLFVIAIVSGIVLYAPFMRRLEFGTVRAERNPRLKWLDLHNFLGVVTIVWAFAVGATGVINELSKPLFGLWQMTDVKAMLKPWRGQATPAQSELGSVDSAFETAQAAVPGMKVVSVVLPGADFGSPHHFLLWAKGDTKLTSRLFSPVLIDARTGALAALVSMPWYLRVLEISRPLHFGDYGGASLKIVWALLDLVTILVLGSGLYLWFGRRSGRHASSAVYAKAIAGTPSSISTSPEVAE